MLHHIIFMWDYTNYLVLECMFWKDYESWSNQYAQFDIFPERLIIMLMCKPYKMDDECS